MPKSVEFNLIRADIAGHPTLVVYGELDIQTSPKLHEALSQLVAEKPPVAFIDLANVTFLDSSALGALVVAHRHMGESDGELRLVAVPKSVRRVFEAAGLADRFHVHADATSATTWAASTSG